VTRLQILGRANSFNVRKVLWVCDELGVDYTREDWGRGFRSTTEAEFLRINPDRRADKDTDPNRRTRSHGPPRVLPRSEFKVRGQYSKPSGGLKR
jgi:hypothetical protein